MSQVLYHNDDLRRQTRGMPEDPIYCYPDPAASQPSNPIERAQPQPVYTDLPPKGNPIHSLTTLLKRKQNSSPDHGSGSM